MVSGFAFGLNTIVTADAVPGHAGMIKTGRIPRLGCVTVLAGIGSRNMIGRLAFGHDTVVARHT